MKFTQGARINKASSAYARIQSSLATVLRTIKSACSLRCSNNMLREGQVTIEIECVASSTFVSKCGVNEKERLQSTNERASERAPARRRRHILAIFFVRRTGVGRSVCRSVGRYVEERERARSNALLTRTLPTFPPSIAGHCCTYVRHAVGIASWRLWPPRILAGAENEPRLSRCQRKTDGLTGALHGSQLGSLGAYVEERKAPITAE